MKKIRLSLVLLTLTLSMCLCFGSLFAFAEGNVNTKPSTIYFSTHAGYIPNTTIEETSAGINKYTLTSTGIGSTVPLFTYEPEITAPINKNKENLISFSFKSVLSDGLEEPIKDFFFNFGFRLSECSLPSWNQTFGVYLTLYPSYDGEPAKLVLAVSDGAPISPASTDELLANSIHKANKNYLDGAEHTVDIAIDDIAMKIELVMDKGTTNEIKIQHVVDAIDDTPDIFNNKGGYSFMSFGSKTVITNFKAVDTREEPKDPLPKPDPIEPTPDPVEPTPDPVPPAKPAKKGCANKAAASAAIAIIFTAASLAFIKR